jgi:hypothetical protein
MRLPFEIDPQIFHHIIYRQADSMGKAAIERLMNGVVWLLERNVAAGLIHVEDYLNWRSQQKDDLC